MENIVAMAHASIHKVMNSPFSKPGKLRNRNLIDNDGFDSLHAMRQEF
jgi:hypothetical protein